MALKAGYVGIKKSMLGVISSLAGAKIVKTIGDGLKLTSAGELSADINTETMEFINGKLSAKTAAVDYDTDEVDTGAKWTDGKTIYRKVIHSDTAIANGTTLVSGAEHVVNAYGSQLYSGGSGSNRWYNFPYGAGVRWELFAESHDIKALVTDTGFSTCDWVFEYTKVTPAENNIRKKGGTK